MRIEQEDRKMLYSDEGKFLVVKESLIPIITEEETLYNVQYFQKAIIPHFLTIEKCQEMYVEMTMEEINSVISNE